MLVTYFRSSSYNTWSFCGMQYFLTYVLGMRPDEQNGWTVPKPQKKADKGSICHKVLELLASKKQALQESRATFTNDEIGRHWDAAAFTVDEAIETAWNYYTKEKATPFEWDHWDYKDVRKWSHAAMEFSGGLFNPLNRTIIRPEEYFDFTIDEPWARYAYELPGGERVEGQLALKGTVDLIAKVDGFDDTIELIDWKTGMRKDWATGKPKSWKKLREDPQLRLYHYALSRLYPQVKHVIITIVWIQDGGPFSLDFGPQDLAKTEKMLRERFETIKQCKMPNRIIKDPVHKWKCERLCAFGMNDWEGTGKTVCNHIHGELVNLGMDRVTAKYAVGNAFANYGDGGGRSGEKTGR